MTMKNLKNIYKLLLLLPLVFTVGCDDSDDMVDIITNTTTAAESTVFIETDDANAEVVTSVDYGASQTITAGVNNAPESDITVSFSVTRNGATAILGTHYTLEDVTISSGTNYGSSAITFYASGTFDVSVNSASSSLKVVGNDVSLKLIPMKEY